MKQIGMAFLSMCLIIGGCGTQAQDLDKALSQVSAPTQVKTQAPDKTNSTNNGVLRMVQAIPLPVVEGRFDHFAIDLQRQHLFVAALGNDTLEVLDLREGKRLRSTKSVSE